MKSANPLIEFKGLPMFEYPLFGQYWDQHAKSYNRLSKKMEKAGIDIKLLIDVVHDVQQVERLSMIRFLETGLNHLNNTGDLGSI